MLVLLLLILFDLPLDRVDVIERNHVHDADGKRTFTQLILWRVCPGDDRERVVAWRMEHCERSIWRHSGEWRILWEPGREVSGTSFRESFTPFDPELDDRKKWPSELRRGLRTK